MTKTSFKLFARIDQRIVELDNIAICFLTADEAQRFSKFAAFCSAQMEELGDDYSHEHFAGGSATDLTIERLLEP